MSYATRPILLLSDDLADMVALAPMFDNHIDKIELSHATSIPDNWDDYALVITRRDLIDCPIQTYKIPSTVNRVGHIVDVIENMLLKMTEPEDMTYRQYTLLCRDNRLLIDGKSIPLTETEKNIIRALIESSDNGLNRDEMLKNIWDYRPDLDTHTLETHIYRLRQKMETNPTNPEYLCTIPNGYKLA